MTTMTTPLTKTATMVVTKAGEQLPEGEFEAVVSVFGNVDSVGDRVMPGAFTRTLDEWKASGDPIPVIWSHRWDDPEYHLGQVIDAKETPEGLLVRAKIDTSDRVGEKVARLLKGRQVKEFSFAYDVVDSREVDEGGAKVLELLDLELYEVGPTLIGANRATRLLAAKSAQRKADLDQLTELVRGLVAGVEKVLAAQADTTEKVEALAAALPEGADGGQGSDGAGDGGEGADGGQGGDGADPDALLAEGLEAAGLG